ncbi:oligopeptide ABC transporter oligopeptide-binding protein [Bradyrhizobium sp. WSM 1738]|uniref:ABC transporter substrate-binding protein n=1 Tax=Bradyrhizobium hereditatis TaxID=2821405 RepID=UPI001CE303B3|nr:ABC transporter substrate-binding protein [Bradyrhizobium hereditatis]MCA6115239.1 oligopeptide ABC transporter oligopeptide-binding protein [Bradyrhizobium hereditatis]
MKTQSSFPRRLLLPILAISLTAFHGAASAFAHDLVIAVQKNPDNHDPVSENSNPNLRLMYSLYDTLVSVDYRNGGRLVPNLATSWSVIDPRTIEFHLRPGVVFHNGDTFDARDVVATFSPVRIGADKSVPVQSQPFFKGIDRVEVVDEMTIRIHMKSDDAVGIYRFSTYPSQIISATALEQAKTYAEFTEVDAGSGPYSLVSRKLGGDIVIKKFDKYWGSSKAAADKVTFTVVPELATRIAGLLSGQFDIITEVGADELRQIEAKPSCAIVGGPVQSIRGLVYDSIGSPIADPRIRRALNLAINRDALVKSLFAGRTSVPHGWQMQTFGDMYLSDRPTPEYNPKKARELLKDAGYSGQQIVYRTQQGYYTKQGDTAQILQSMWKAVGLNVKLEFKENWAQVRADTPDRAIIDADSGAYYPDPMGQFWRRMGPGEFTDSQFFTVGPSMLTLGNELATSLDTKRRRAIFAKMLENFEEDPHAGILYVTPMFMGMRKDRLSMDPLPYAYLDLTTDGVTFK